MNVANRQRRSTVRRVVDEPEPEVVEISESTRIARQKLMSTVVSWLL